jgi:hypothetical protein
MCGILDKSLDVLALRIVPAGGMNSHLAIGPLGGKLGEWLGVDPREAVVVMADCQCDFGGQGNFVLRPL